MGSVKKDVCVLFYWLIIYLFPPSLRGGERRGLGQRPKASCKVGSCCLIGTSPLQAVGIHGFLQRSLLSAEGANYLLASIPSRNVTIRVRKRNEQLNLIIGVCFHPSRWPELAPFQSFLVKFIP